MSLANKHAVSRSDPTSIYKDDSDGRVHLQNDISETSSNIHLIYCVWHTLQGDDRFIKNVINSLAAKFLFIRSFFFIFSIIMLIVILWSFIHPVLIKLPWTQSQLGEQTNSHPHPNPIYNHQPNLRSKSLDFGMKPLEEQEEHELKQKGQPQSFNLKPFFFLGGDSANRCTTTPSLDWLVN